MTDLNTTVLSDFDASKLLGRSFRLVRFGEISLTHRLYQLERSHLHRGGHTRRHLRTCRARNKGTFPSLPIHHPATLTTLVLSQMGVYYMAPLLGPSLGPIFGGALTTGFSWRAIFWFLTVVSGTSFIAFVFLFKDTFRKERSLTYQNALRQRMEHAASKESSRPVSRRPSTENTAQPRPSEKDLEKANAKAEAMAVQEPPPDIKPSLKDLSPIRPIGLVLRRKNNSMVLFASGSSIPLPLCRRC